MSWIFVKSSAGGTPSPWSPQSLSGLLGWYDMSQQAAQTDDTEMTGLSDFSGAGRHLTSYGATKPKFRTAALNGLPGVQFNSSGMFWGTDWVTGQFPLLLDPITVCNVVTLNNTFVNSGVLFGFEHRAAPTVSRFARYSGVYYSNPFSDWKQGLTLDNVACPHAGFNLTPGRGSPAVYVASKDDAGLASLAENGTARSLLGYHRSSAADGVRTSMHDWSAADTYPVTTTRATGIVIGGAINNPQTPTFNFLSPDTVYHFETAFFDRVLTQVEMQKMEGYMAHKWGLTASLPEGHPYKSAAPTS